MKSVFAVALVLAAAGCRWLSEPGGAGEVSSPSDVTLKIGQEVRVDAVLRVGFAGVPADSRCPATADCIWAGDGVVAITASVGMGPTYPDTLHTNLDPKLVQFGGYTITLLELRPYPQAPEPPISPGEYAAHLKIERSPAALGR